MPTRSLGAAAQERHFVIQAAMRLGWRPTELFDAPAIQRLAQDPQVGRYLFWDVPFPPEGGRRLALDAVHGWQTGQAASFSLFVEGRLAGIAAIDRIDLRAGSGHLCYWLGAPYWNRGVGSWAVGELVQWARQACRPHGRLTTLFANCLAENEPSVRILCKNGFHEHSRFLGSGDHGGKFAGCRWARYCRALGAGTT